MPTHEFKLKRSPTTNMYTTRHCHAPVYLCSEALEALLWQKLPDYITFKVSSRRFPGSIKVKIGALGRVRSWRLYFSGRARAVLVPSTLIFAQDLFTDGLAKPMTLYIKVSLLYPPDFYEED